MRNLLSVFFICIVFTMLILSACTKPVEVDSKGTDDLQEKEATDSSSQPDASLGIPEVNNLETEKTELESESLSETESQLKEIDW